jgi:hypothetical protein
MFDHADVPPKAMRPERGTFVDLFVELDGAWYGPLEDDGWSPVRSPSGRPPSIADPSSVRYAAKFKMGAPSSKATILLASPVLDDVTLYYDRGGAESLSWVCP